MKTWTKEEQEVIKSYKRDLTVKSVKTSAVIGLVLGVGVLIYKTITAFAPKDY